MKKNLAIMSKTKSEHAKMTMDFCRETFADVLGRNDSFKVINIA